MSGHEKSNYAGLYARQAYQTKKDSLSQPATAARNLPYEPVQHLKTKKGFFIFSDSGFMTYQPQI
jgi:hypothetical protein